MAGMTTQPDIDAAARFLAAGGRVLMTWSASALAARQP